MPAGALLKRRSLGSLGLLALHGAVAIACAGYFFLGTVHPRLAARDDNRVTAAAAEMLAERSLRVPDGAALAAALAAWDLAAAEDGEIPPAVAPLYVGSMPPDLDRLGAAARRKATFVKITLPLVLAVNDLVRQERAKLLEIDRRFAEGRSVGYADRRWLADLARRYRVRDGDRAELLKRVDEIPPALAVAQAAVESGWGASLLAREANALFGQKSFSITGFEVGEWENGVPVRYRRFGSLLEGIGAYARNLNSHPAYAAFRAKRARLRATGDDLDSLPLAATLTAYSTRGKDYVAQIQKIIRSNALQPYDEAYLRDRVTPQLLYVAR